MIYIPAYKPHRFLQIYQRYAYIILYIYRANIRLLSYYFDRYNVRQDLSWCTFAIHFINIPQIF